MMRLASFHFPYLSNMTQPQPFTVQIADWSEQHDALAKIRIDVFVNEQNVPAEMELDALDADAVHVAACDAAGNVIGTGRLLLNQPIPRIGRMAVVKSWRSVGVGAKILETLCDVAKERGFEKVMLHSQTHASPYYFMHGFLSRGTEFFEAGIPHQAMHKHI